MQVMDAILSRRSIRKYSDKPIEQEKLNLIAEAFRQSPSAANAQHWKLLFISDEQARKAVRGATKSDPLFLQQAPVILVACGTNPGTMSNAHRADSIDLSIGLSYAILEAWELGLGTCWMASYDEEKLKAALNLPQSMSVVAITPLGYPEESPDAKPRKPLEEVVEFI